MPITKKITQYELADNTSYDVVIIPGVPFIPPSWNEVMQMRLIWAKHLYQTKKAKHFITSGSAVYSPYVEANVMKAYLVQMGVPDSLIIIEDKAQHSTENVWYSYQKAMQMGFKTVAFASDPFQTSVLYYFAKKRVPSMRFLPVLFDTLQTLNHHEPFINQDSLLVKNFVALPEKENWFTRFSGTLGKHIPYSKP
ncbi:MAG: YdcF family protein [Bacteroidetes bacterium]|nr:YdcF family protein [Bacteroidota bacterium]